MRWFGWLLAGILSGCTAETAPPITLVTSVGAVELPDGAPAAARHWRDTLTRYGRVVWGLNAPLPLFGSQVHQESGWNPDAQSPAGAQGIAQFMPGTANWIDDAYPELGPAAPLNPEWALQALVRYDRHLFDRIRLAASECDQFAFMLSGYNGGEKWVMRDRDQAAIEGKDANRYWASVEMVNAGRTTNAWSENRGYSRRIIRVLQPQYATWGRNVCQELS